MEEYWLPKGFRTSITVSDSDWTALEDSLYFFSHWNTGIDTASILYDSLAGPLDLTAHYNGFIINLAMCVRPSDSTVIDFDTLDILETVVSTREQMVSIINCGDTPFDLGLRILSSTRWAAGHSPGDNRYTLRAKFFDEIIEPEPFDMALDEVKTSLAWADFRLFGDNGWNVTSEEMEYLWFQLLTPMTSRDYNLKTTIKVELRAKMRLY